MIRTPRLPPSFTSRLCSPIHRLTSLLACQPALSHTNTRTFLPTASSPSEHHERKRFVMALTGRPSTIRREDCPFSLQACSEGRAKRLHQVSSSKPTAHPGSRSAKRISRSRRLFFWRTRGRGGDPALGV